MHTCFPGFKREVPDTVPYSTTGTSPLTARKVLLCNDFMVPPPCSCPVSLLEPYRISDGVTALE